MAHARFLLGIPGEMHFRSTDVGGVGKVDLDEILVACLDTLEVFSFRPRSCKFIRDTVFQRGLLYNTQSFSSLPSVRNGGPEPKFGSNPL